MTPALTIAEEIVPHIADATIWNALKTAAQRVRAALAAR
jgi:hypothetical protein